MRSKILITILIIIGLSSTGCIKIKKGEKADGNLGGVFVTKDGGENWARKSLIPTLTGKPKSFSFLNVASMEIDPGDSKAIYFGSVGEGLIYTYDSGENWQIAKNLGEETINAIAIDPKNKCIIYAAKGNKIYKSIDCNRNWEQIYQDNDTGVIIDNIEIDYYNTAILYFSVSRGDVIKSSDSGVSWHTSSRFKDKIRSIVIDPNDSRIVYVATKEKGLWRTIDGGENWEKLEELEDVMKKEKINKRLQDVVVVGGDSHSIFIATYYGLLKSIDNGKTWERISLIPPEKKATINAIAVNPKNTNEISYVTNTTFYKSVDGGENWKTLPLPTTRAGQELLLDPLEPNIMYLGVKEIKK